MKKLTEKQKEILKKVEQIEIVKNYRSRCLKAYTCPECGGGLLLKPGPIRVCDKCGSQYAAD